MEDAGMTRQDIDGAVHGMMASPHRPTQWTYTYSRAMGLNPNLSVARGGQAAPNGIVDCQPGDVEIGSAVEARYLDVPSPGDTLPFFVPAESHSSR
jgi:hypothetical protein